MNKRGQGPATGTAVLLAIIAALLIGFIILMPPQERMELLGDETTVTTDDELETAVSEKNLLTISPGRIDYLAQKEIEHPLPVIHIYTKAEAKVLAEKNIAYVKKSTFSEDVSKFSFEIPDLENTKDVLLDFNVIDTRGGRLVITLNDDEIFNSEVKIGGIQPINIPKNLLKEENQLTFAVSSPGIAFWATNDVYLEQIKIIGEVTSLEAQSSKNIFLVSKTEKGNLEKAVLKFQPSCNMGEVGKLTITINGKVIYSAVPDCDLAMIPIEFSPDSIYQGENEIVFNTAKGMYLLSHVVVESDLEEIVFPTYYFELSHEEYEEILDEKKSVRLKMDFVDVVARKYGGLVFNGHVKYFDTKELSYTIDLSVDVVQGANAIQIKPKKTLDVRELKVDMVK